MWNSSTCDCGSNKTCKIFEYLDIKNFSGEKYLFDKLGLTCGDEILNTTKASLNRKKVTCEKNNCLILTISLVIICLLLLVVISISCYYYYTRD